MIDIHAARKLSPARLAFEERDLSDAIRVQVVLRSEGFSVPKLNAYRRELRAVVHERLIRTASAKRARKLARVA